MTMPEMNDAGDDTQIIDFIKFCYFYHAGSPRCPSLFYNAFRLVLRLPSECDKLSKQTIF